ncbi:hypothetical protein ACROYT_G015638 [Oculina patagonica]
MPLLLMVVRRDKVKTQTLTPAESVEVMPFYRAKCPTISCLYAIYEAVRHHASLARRLSAFPPMSSSQPASHFLSPGEATMIQVGDACETKYHFIHITSKRAYKVLRGEELEAEKREESSTRSSFVYLNEEATTPLFGRAVIEKRVKQVTNYVNHLITKQPAIDPKELPKPTTSRTKSWLEEFDEPSSRSTSRREAWDDEKAELLERRFQGFPSLPSTYEIKGILQNESGLTTILEEEGWTRTCTKIKNIFKKHQRKK